MFDNYNMLLIDALNISAEMIKDYNSDYKFISGDNENNDDYIFNRIDKKLLETDYLNINETESHDYNEVGICIFGSCAIQLGSHFYETSSGSVFLIPSGLLHCEHPKRCCDYTVIWIVLQPDKTLVSLSSIDIYKKDEYYVADGCSLETNKEYDNIIDSINTELENKLFNFNEMIRTYILQLIITIIRNTLKTKISLNTKLWAKNIALRVQKYVNNNYTKHIILDEVAQEIGISANHLNVIFKSVVGKTIMHYIEDRKIFMAKKLLKDTNCSIMSISDKLGYFDQYYFSKVFKRVTGVSPTQFRKFQ